MAYDKAIAYDSLKKWKVAENELHQQIISKMPNSQECWQKEPLIINGAYYLFIDGAEKYIDSNLVEDIEISTPSLE